VGGVALCLALSRYSHQLLIIYCTPTQPTQLNALIIDCTPTKRTQLNALIIDCTPTKRTQLKALIIEVIILKSGVFVN
jgi:hypothetical protein